MNAYPQCVNWASNFDDFLPPSWVDLLSVETVQNVAMLVFDDWENLASAPFRRL
jgi:hypothetical protein